MKPEIEAKFLYVNHDEIRAKLKKLGAKLEQPMRLMRRILFDYPDNRFQRDNNTRRLRIRDEGNRIMVNFKHSKGGNYVHEIETSVGSYEDMANILTSIGLVSFSDQESKRETWSYKGTEIVLDEWPWLETYIEIEGPTEESIKVVAKDLGFDWKQAEFGSVDTAYKAQYPGMTGYESIGDLTEVKFNQPLPKWLEDRK